MTNSDDMLPPAVGVYWIKEEDYAAVLEIFPDRAKMPRTWRLRDSSMLRWRDWPG